MECTVAARRHSSDAVRDATLHSSIPMFADRQSESGLEMDPEMEDMKKETGKISRIFIVVAIITQILWLKTGCFPFILLLTKYVDRICVQFSV